MFVNTEIRNNEKPSSIMSQLDGITEFIKYSYATNLNVHCEDDDHCHDVKFGLIDGNGFVKRHMK